MTSSGPASATVLVVDDNDGIRLVFADWLRRAGYTVHEALDGQQGLDLVARIPFDLVLLDVHLPDISGMEVCARIKSNRATRSVPVLQISATAIAPADRSAALDNGADAYIMEPVQRDDLLATVRALLRYNEARRSAEWLAARLERLHQATLLMNAAATMADLLQLATTGAVSVFGVPCCVAVSRDDGARVAWARPGDIEATTQASDARTVGQLGNRAQRGDTVPADELPDTLRLGAAALASSLTTPRGELIGALLLFGAHTGAEEALMLDHYSQALAVALENQRLYAVEHDIAHTLQRAMLPASLPEVAHLEVDARYQPASDTADIGGDFYEVIALDEHRTLLAVGDVAGHSLRAATVMAELRHTLRALADLRLGPPEILRRLNETLLRSARGFTATLCLVVVDTRTRRIEVTNAGHLPPVLRDASGTRLVDAYGALLGLAGRPDTKVVAEPLEPGALIVLITDGLVERREEDLAVGLDRLLRAVIEGDDAVSPVCDRLLAAVGAGEASFDDIAILAARHV